MTGPRESKGDIGPLAGIGALVAAVVCCAAPLLIASGILAGAGGVLRSIWPFLLAGAALMTAVAVTGWRHRRRRGDGDDSPSQQGDEYTDTPNRSGAR